MEKQLHFYIFKRLDPTNVEVITDEWTGYNPLKKEYPKLKQIPSNRGKNQPNMRYYEFGWMVKRNTSSL